MEGLKMEKVPEYINGQPNISGFEEEIEKAIKEAGSSPAFLDESPIELNDIKSAFSIALHMHQPLIPAGGDDLRTAEIISNLQYMMEHQDLGDNHNAPVFLWCYKRMGEFIPQLVEEGLEPRVMLDYSGTLLHGLRHMRANDVMDSLKGITCNQKYSRYVEWLGSAWGHPVAPSTPMQDYRLHVRAWQQHFAALFSMDALKKVRGFSPAEMALPNHPDVAYEFVKILKECGYRWVLVQEHTVEMPENGHSPEAPHLPHRLVCTNSDGRSVSITAIVKTQGSDTKLVGQMQPYYEVKGLAAFELNGKRIPSMTAQISDGENGGVMMNEFPPKYFAVMRECAGSDTPAMNCTEYLEKLFASGVTEEDFPVVQPVFQRLIWEHFDPGQGRERLEQVIKELREKASRFTMEGGSWTNNLSWVRGYRDVLGPMEEVSTMFFEKVLKSDISSSEHRYRNALFHLMCCQTSCFRYWGQGIWTDYAREICRRTKEILKHDF